MASAISNMSACYHYTNSDGFSKLTESCKPQRRYLLGANIKQVTLSRIVGGLVTQFLGLCGGVEVSLTVRVHQQEAVGNEKGE